MGTCSGQYLDRVEEISYKHGSYENPTEKLLVKIDDAVKK